MNTMKTNANTTSTPMLSGLFRASAIAMTGFALVFVAGLVMPHVADAFYSTGGTCTSCGGGKSVSTPSYSSGGSKGSIFDFGGSSKSYDSGKSYDGSKYNFDTGKSYDSGKYYDDSKYQYPTGNSSSNGGNYVFSYNNNSNSNSNTNNNIITIGNGGGSHNDDEDVVCDISANDTSIEEGDSTSLHWTSEGATSATLSGFGSVATGGSRTVSPDNTTTYTLHVSGQGGSDTCSVTVHVEEQNDNSNDLSCDLSASDTRVEEGDRVTLEWDIDGDATYASINQGVGRVDEDGGSERVTVDEDTTYRLTVRNDDGDEDTCSVSVRVDDNNNFSSVDFTGDSVNNPQVVYLSDIPYTGLEDINPVLLSYYLMLIAAAGAGVWFAYQKGMIPAFSFASAEPVDEGHIDEVVEEGHIENPAVESFLASLEAGNTDAAVDALRDAAANGTGVEEFLETAEGAASSEELQARVNAALAASRETGIRGAKEALA